MELIQTVIIFIIIAILLFLIINALITESIWVKGGKTGFFNFKELVHKKYRENNPFSYWGYFSFYLSALLWLIYLKIN